MRWHVNDAAHRIEEWATAYDELEPLYDAFCEKLEALVSELLDGAEIPYQWTNKWMFPREDFIHAMRREIRRGKQLEDPFRELTDFAGVTVVVANHEDAGLATELFEREFVFDPELSISPADGNDALRYECHRLAVSIDAMRAALTEWRAYQNLVVRLEVQTVLQYAWERLDNSQLPFHNDRSYPAAVRDVISDFVASLRAADTQFAEVWPLLSLAENEYMDDVRAGQLDAELNAASLFAYLRASKTVSELMQRQVAAGRTLDEEYVPSRQAVERETLWLTERNRLRTLAQLDDFLTSAGERATALLDDIFKTADEQGFECWVYPDSLVEWLLLVLGRADAETVALMRYVDEIEDALNMVIGNPVAPKPD